MPHQGHRRTSSDKRRRASHFALKKVGLAACAKCKSPVRPHHACSVCGNYDGRAAVDMSRSLERAVKKTQQAQPAESEPAPKPEKKAKKESKEQSAKE